MLVVALVGLLTLAGCSSPTMLRESDFDDVTQAQHGTGGTPPSGWWCNEFDPDDGRLGAYSTLALDESEADWFRFGATLIEAEPGFTATHLLEQVQDGAARCAEKAERVESLSMEPLTGLPEGAVGWRGVHHTGGETFAIAVVAVDETHLLMVGWYTLRDDAPIEINELIRLGLEGVERVGLDD